MTDLGLIHNIIGMVKQFSAANDATNEQLARWLILQGGKVGMGSKEGDLYEACAERLCPGVLDMMADEEKGDVKHP